jgi:hypothetical protein
MLNYNIKIKRAISTRWSQVNPILSAGELGLESDTARLKVGDGSSSWNTLEYLYVDPSPIDDDITYGRRNGEWVDIYNTANLQLSMGTYSEVNSYIPLSGEPIYDSTNKVVYIGDGSTVRGNLIGNVSKFAEIASVPLSAGGSYTTPLSVTLNSLNSIWEITSYLLFSSVDGDNETSINLYPTINNISIKSFDSVSSINNGPSTFNTSLSELILNTLWNDTYSVKARNIVQLTGSSATFGIKYKENSAFDTSLTYMNIIATRIS